MADKKKHEDLPLFLTPEQASKASGLGAVSYTHLTLPTKLEV